MVLSPAPESACFPPPVSCSPQPCWTRHQPAGIPCVLGRDPDYWHFHQRHPVCQSPGPEPKHPGQQSDHSSCGNVRETTYLLFNHSVLELSCSSSLGQPQGQLPDAKAMNQQHAEPKAEGGVLARRAALCLGAAISLAPWALPACCTTVICPIFLYKEHIHLEGWPGPTKALTAWPALWPLILTGCGPK